MLLQWNYFRNMTSDHHGFMVNDLSTYLIRRFCPCGHILQKETTAKYDKVLLDAPCSGLGVLSKVPFFIKYISSISSFQFSFEPIWNSGSGSTSYCIINLLFFNVPKRADLRWNRQFEDLEELMCLQDELLDSASM
jgi:16S rRNA (cytosine967-C5)-methyltransferase